jgi:uncharacterized protein (DUF488 family)
MKRRKSAKTTPFTLFTIGFTERTAESFFGALQDAGVRTVIDTRLNNRSQLSGFAKKRDLEYFLRSISGIQYEHDLALAPTKELLTPYKAGKLTWNKYQQEFNELLEERAPADHNTRDRFDNACLLCSEHEADHCHRRLVAEYLQRSWPEMTIRHL